MLVRFLATTHRFEPSHGMIALKKSFVDRKVGDPCNTACPAGVRVMGGDRHSLGADSLDARRADCRRNLPCAVKDPSCSSTVSGVDATAVSPGWSALVSPPSSLIG